ncbi:hypothetical protein F5Y18DRAFT_433154 [Xylariaceae sp. FL1019]|nr:hypothetical protein F5Y18DRAFT_433154 [Xylariaceae sp. FL1019]
MSDRRSQYSSSYPSSQTNRRRRHGHADEDEIDPFSTSAYAGYQYNASSHRFSSDRSGYHSYASEDAGVASVQPEYGPFEQPQFLSSGSTQTVFRIPQYQTWQSQAPALASDFCPPNSSAAAFPGASRQQPQERWTPSYPPAVDSSSGQGNAFARQTWAIPGPQDQPAGSSVPHNQRRRRLSTQARNGSWDEQQTQQTQRIDPGNAPLDEEDGSDTSEDARRSVSTRYVMRYMDRDDHPWCPRPHDV